MIDQHRLYCCAQCNGSHMAINNTEFAIILTKTRRARTLGRTNFLQLVLLIYSFYFRFAFEAVDKAVFPYDLEL